MKLINPLTQEVEYFEECSGCNDPIYYENWIDEEFFTTIDDRIFHKECWDAWLQEGYDAEVIQGVA